MRQTVTGRFKTWNEARHAQDVLMLRGFAPNDIELPAHGHGVLAGVERLISSFFTTDPRARGARDMRDMQATPQTPEDPVLIGVHVTDEVHAGLARETLREEQALEVATHGTGWGWAADETPGTRTHSALEELGLAGIAQALRQRVAAASSTPMAQDEASGVPASAMSGDEVAREAGMAAPRSVEVAGAPEAVRPAQEAAPQIPDEFLEYEDDTPAHHRTLH